MQAAAAAWRQVVSAAAETATEVPAVSRPLPLGVGGSTTPALDPPPMSPAELGHPPLGAAAAPAPQGAPPSFPRPPDDADAVIVVNSVDPEVPIQPATQPPPQRPARASWRHPQRHLED